MALQADAECLAGDERESHIQIGTEFNGVSGSAGIVAGDLTTAGEGVVGVFKAGNVIPLPCVDAQRDLIESRHDFFGVDAVSFVDFRGNLVEFCSCVHDKFLSKFIHYC
jgi:hypothetical protein